MEFNDDLVDGTPEGIELVERLDAWNRVRRIFCNLEKDDQRAPQMVFTDRMPKASNEKSRRISQAVQRRVKGGLNSLAEALNMVSWMLEHPVPSALEVF